MKSESTGSVQKLEIKPDLRVRAFRPEMVPHPWLKKQPRFGLPIGHLAIEIGCGTGLHSAEFARSHPDKALIAIEQTTEKFRKFTQALQRDGAPENLYPIHGDAISWICHQIPENSISEYFLLYPNPWPKKRDLNQRWHAMPFMSYLLKTLQKGGRMILATNEPWYGDEARDYMVNYWGLMLDQALILKEGSRGLTSPTLFEKKYLARGESCFHYEFRKL